VRFKHGLSLVLVAVAVALAGTVVAGCGGGSASGSGNESSNASNDGGGGSSQSYEEVLRDLKKAALAKTSYNAVRHAEDLEEVDESAVNSFCEFAWQIGANREGAKLSEHEYIVARIRLDIENELGIEEGESDATPAEIKAAMEKLRSVVDLPSLNGDLTNRYSKACTN
jgi:hypothetical protein